MDGRDKPGHDSRGSETQPEPRSFNSYRYKSHNFLAKKQKPEYHLFCVQKPRVQMSDQPKPPSERAHKRAVGKIRRELLIKRRETYFDLLVSGYSVEQIASYTKKSPSAIRRAIGQALAKRQFDAPEDYARLQVARLTKALRCADVSLEEGDLKAVAPFLKVVRELNLYHGVNVGSTRLAAPAAPPEIAPASPPLALTHSPGVAMTELFEDEESCAKAQLSS